MERPELVIFVGLPGSGKSTCYFAHFADSHVHVSKDLLPNARGRDDRQSLQVERALADGRSVVVDNTNPTRDVRAPLIAIGRRHGARIIAYYFECSVRLAIVRNAQRDGKGRVPKVAIFTTQKKLQPPAAEEGFDELHVIKQVERTQDSGLRT
jgi:predicted kinase